MATRHCTAVGCVGKCPPGRLLCNHHRNLREKERDLAAWAYRKLRSNCSRRRKAAPPHKKGNYVFTITLEYFRQFCVETQILMERGRSATSMHVDRIIEELGYTPGNLRALSNTDNIQKEWARRKGIVFDWELAYRQRTGRYQSEEEALADEGVSLFRYVERTPEVDAEEYGF